MFAELKYWHLKRERLVEKMRGLSDLQQAGVEHRVHHHVLADDFSVDMAVRCRDGQVVLYIPRRYDIPRDGFAHTKRQIIEALLDQLQQALAVEALEGR